MNAPRRRQIKKVIESLNDELERIEELLSNEEEYKDNMPENLQGSERYETSEASCDSLQEAIDNLTDTISSLEEIDGVSD